MYRYIATIDLHNKSIEIVIEHLETLDIIVERYFENINVIVLKSEKNLNDKSDIHIKNLNLIEKVFTFKEQE